MKYYTVETLAMSIDPNRDYTVKEIEGLYQDYLSNLDGTVEFYRDIDAALARYKEIDQGVIEHGPAAILVIAEVYGWEAPREIGEGDIRDPAGFRGHPTDCDLLSTSISCLNCIDSVRPENDARRGAERPS